MELKNTTTEAVRIQLSQKGKSSKTFSVYNTSTEEVEKLIKDAIKNN